MLCMILPGEKYWALLNRYMGKGITRVMVETVVLQLRGKISGDSNGNPGVFLRQKCLI